MRNGVVAVFPSGLVAYRVPSSHPRRPGRRGTINGFSRNSRRRLMRRLMSIDWSVAEGQSARRARVLFVTLTYPFAFPDDFRLYKRHLDSFFKRVSRRFPGYGAVWKLEYQRRGAPHYHIVLFLPRPVNLGYFRLWVSTAWYEVVGSGDMRHLRAGTNVRIVYPGRGLMAYFAKYIAKVWHSDAPTGRVWGVVGSIPYGRVVLVGVDWVEFLRRLRRWGKNRPYFRRVRPGAVYGVTIYGHGDALFDLCRGIIVPLRLDNRIRLRYNGVNP